LLDQGFGEFKRQLEYKINWQGGILIKVNPQYTSQKCHVCGHIDKENRKSQSNFACIACHHKENADINAAKNILAAGHVVLACGEIGLPNSMKQELLRNCERVAVSFFNQESPSFMTGRMSSKWCEYSQSKNNTGDKI